MSIANFESEREARSFMNKHLLQMHATVIAPYTKELGRSLTVGELFRLHSSFHMDDFSLPPHIHADDDVRSIKRLVPENYIKDLIDLITEDEE